MKRIWRSPLREEDKKHYVSQLVWEDELNKERVCPAGIVEEVYIPVNGLKYRGRIFASDLGQAFRTIKEAQKWVTTVLALT